MGDLGWWAKEGTVPDTPPGPAPGQPPYRPQPIFGKTPRPPAAAAQPAPGYPAPPIQAPPVQAPPPPDEPRWYRAWKERRAARRAQRRRIWRGRLIKLGILIVVGWLLLRSCGPHEPGLLDIRPAPSGPVTSIPGGPVIHTSAADPSDVPAEDLTKRVRAAALDATSYRLRGAVDLSATGPITVDLTLGSDSADGRITKDGSTLEVRRRGLTVSSRAPGAAIWTEGDIATLPNGDALGLRPLLDGGHWITELIPTPESSTASPKTEQQGGRTVTRIRLRGGEFLYVAATGTPYPVKLSQPDQQYPDLTFDGWR